MYKYNNQWQMANELETVLTKLISKKEQRDYICKKISVIIPEHTVEVYGYSGDTTGMSGGDIAWMNEHYGDFYDTTIPTEEYEFIIVMEPQAYQYFQRFSFNDIAEAEDVISVLSEFYSFYSETFDPEILYERFPYLEEFFSTINNMKPGSGRVIIANEVLQESYEKTLKRVKE